MIPESEAIIRGLIACFVTAVVCFITGMVAGSEVETANHRPFCGCKDCVEWRKSREPEERR